MSADDRLWNRDELYEEVWTTPMKTLAKRYGLSDVGLAKTCRKLSIPLPGRGYWARKEAGQKVKRVALPPLKEEIVLQKPIPRPEPPTLSDFATADEIAQVEQLEQMTSETLLKRGNLSHLLIVQARSALKHAQLSDSKILWTRESCLDIRVSKESLNRAFRIMASIISAIEERGFAVTIETLREEKKEQTVARIYGQVIRFGLTEKIDRVESAASPKGGLLERVLSYDGKPVTLEPSGRLSIEVWTGWGSSLRSWRDGKTQGLEDQLPRVVAGFIRIALANRAEQRRRTANEQERQRIAEERANLEKSIKLEQSKVNALRNATARWLRAEQIRSFVSVARDMAVQNDQSVAPGSPFGDWVLWAERQADRIDPLRESPPSIIDRKAETAASHTTNCGYGYQKPDPPFCFPKPLWRMK
jgi:hypothetical protein